MNAFAHFQGFPLLSPLSRNTSESLWRECGAQNVVLGRMMDGTGTDELTQIFTHPSPLLRQENTTTLLWNRIYQLFSELTKCLVIILLVMLIWIGSQRFYFTQGGLWREAGTDPAQEQWPWNSPAPLPEQQQQHSPRFISCMHSSCMWSHSHIIDKNTSSYITILMCPCGAENAITLG